MDGWMGDEEEGYLLPTIARKITVMDRCDEEAGREEQSSPTFDLR